MWGYTSEKSERLWDELTPVPTRANSLRFITTYAGFEGQSKLLASKTAFQNDLDTYKVFLGLPPELEFDVRDPLLDRFRLIDPETTRLTERAGQIALRSHDEAGLTDADLGRLYDALRRGR